MTEDTPAETAPTRWTPRLAMERYLRMRLVGSDSERGGRYVPLRRFVEWCERVGIGALGQLRGRHIRAYAHRRQAATDTATHERELVTIEQFCRFLDDIGASGVENLAPSVPGPRSGLEGSGLDTTMGSNPDRPGLEPRAEQGGGERYRHGDPAVISSDLEPEERVSTAVVRAAGAVDGRRPKYLPPLRNVLDPRALDRLFTEQRDGTPRTGGRLSFVYASCRVVLQSEDRLTIEPLSTARSG